VSHKALLPMLLPPVSYDLAGPLVNAQLEADANALDRALADAAGPLKGLAPFAAQEWVQDYERVYGLPDPCSKPGQLHQERLAALAVALLERRGISRAYYIKLAAILGYAITLHEYRPFAAGSHAGEPLSNGPWVFAWRVDAPETTIRRFCAGRSAAGEPLQAWVDEYLECVLQRLKPAHTIVLFSYGGAYASH